VRLLFPGPRDDGWVRHGRTYRIPARRSGIDLVFSGPPGPEYVYALASLYPVDDRYPDWLVQGMVWDVDPWEYDDVYHTGWVVGDPFYRMRVFCRDLTPYPEWTDTYASSYLYFHLGRAHPYPRYVCSDCHGYAAFDPYGPACSAVRVEYSDIRCTGWIDFRVVFVPRYTYVVHRTWKPRHWHGRHWSGPDGRWVWSTSDGRRLRDQFRDAKPAVVGHEGGRRVWDRGPGGKGGSRAHDAAPQRLDDGGRPDRSGRGPNTMPGMKPNPPRAQADRGPGREPGPAGRGGPKGEPSRSPREARLGTAEREGRPSEDRDNAWRRAHEERLERAVRDREDRGTEARPSVQRESPGKDRGSSPERGGREIARPSGKDQERQGKSQERQGKDQGRQGKDQDRGRRSR
jgi:hypothetical protein